MYSSLLIINSSTIGNSKGYTLDKKIFRYVKMLREGNFIDKMHIMIEKQE